MFDFTGFFRKVNKIKRLCRPVSFAVFSNDINVLPRTVQVSHLSFGVSVGS